MATCQICKYAGNSKDKYPCSDCKGYSKYEYEKPYTNADLHRAMSDDKLAEQFMLFTVDDKLPWCDFHCKKDGKYGCNRCILEWLQQPAKEVK